MRALDTFLFAVIAALVLIVGLVASTGSVSSGFRHGMQAVEE